MHRLPDVWGADSSSFRPERFQSETQGEEDALLRFMAPSFIALIHRSYCRDEAGTVHFFVWPSGLWYVLSES